MMTRESTSIDQIREGVKFESFDSTRRRDGRERGPARAEARTGAPLGPRDELRRTEKKTVTGG